MTRAKYSAANPPEPGQWFVDGPPPLGVPGVWLNTYTSACADGSNPKECRDFGEFPTGMGQQDVEGGIGITGDKWCYVGGPITEPPEPMPALPAGWSWNGTAAQSDAHPAWVVSISTNTGGVIIDPESRNPGGWAPPRVIEAVIEVARRDGRIPPRGES